MQHVTVGLSLHRPEMLPFLSEWMRRHDAIFLEDPPTPGFDRMIRGELSIEDYLLPTDMEYPEFARGLCLLMRELHTRGKTIHQVEPFIESLLYIHEFFADGHSPGDLARDSIHYHVHRAERAATGALLAYYQSVATGSFEMAVEAVLRFARADAARFRLRDSLRAQALAALVPHHASSYIESGLIHYRLWRLLRDRLGSRAEVRAVFPADAALESLNAKGRLYGPGDRLTLLYVFHPDFAQPERERLLAARSIVYSKILKKQESDDEKGTFPHLRDELACIRAVQRLSLEDCRRLFPRVRQAGTREARRVVRAFAALPGHRQTN